MAEHVTAQRVTYLYEQSRLLADVLYQVEVGQRLEDTDVRESLRS